MGHFSLFLGNHEVIKGKGDAENRKTFSLVGSQGLWSCTLKNDAYRLHRGALGELSSPLMAHVLVRQDYVPAMEP